MNSRKTAALVLMVLAAVALVALGACKSSGMAVTSRGQLMKINITAPDNLAEGDAGEIIVAVSNGGVNKINDVEFEVTLPPQLDVMTERHGDGINMTRSMSANGGNVYHYSVGNIEVTDESKVSFSVRTRFGSMRETEAIQVTAWQKNLPGDSLKESKVIKLRS